MELDALLLSRLQFALTIMFHYIFPPLSIGLGMLMVILEGMYLRTKNPVWEASARFWTKVFAVNFAMGVASGIVMEFQFGTNWATYSRYVGDVFGSALAAEGIFAFFLESGFLAVLVFGWDRVGPRMHFFATTMVALGAVFSSVWIVVANSWQQTPAGYHIVMTEFGPRAEITEFWEMVFNPSSMNRLAHVLIGAAILAGFFMLSITAYYILKKKHLAVAKANFKVALGFALFFSLLAPIQGHFQAETVAETQPQKMAAFEAHYVNDGEGAPLVIFGIPNDEEQRVDYAVEIPGMTSLLIHGDPDEPVYGLNDFPEDSRPPVLIPFMTYHLMIGLGLVFIAVTVLATFFWWRGTIFEKRKLLWLIVLMVPLPYLANQAGWVAAEVGRQPYIVYPEQIYPAAGPATRQATEAPDGSVAVAASDEPIVSINPERTGLRTDQGLSQQVKAEHVLGSIIMFGIIYVLLFAVWIFVLHSKIKAGPESVEELAEHKRKVAEKRAGTRDDSDGDDDADGFIRTAAATAGRAASLTEAKSEAGQEELRSQRLTRVQHRPDQSQPNDDDNRTEG